jgi:hypothetical protein
MTSGRDNGFTLVITAPEEKDHTTGKHKGRDNPWQDRQSAIRCSASHRRTGGRTERRRR